MFFKYPRSLNHNKDSINLTHSNNNTTMPLQIRSGDNRRRHIQKR